MVETPTSPMKLVVISLRRRPEWRQRAAIEMATEAGAPFESRHSRGMEEPDPRQRPGGGLEAGLHQLHGVGGCGRGRRRASGGGHSQHPRVHAASARSVAHDGVPRAPWRARCIAAGANQRRARRRRCHDGDDASSQQMLGVTSSRNPAACTPRQIVLATGSEIQDFRGNKRWRLKGLLGAVGLFYDRWHAKPGTIR